MSAVLCWLNVRDVRIGGFLPSLHFLRVGSDSLERRHLIPDHLGWFKFDTEDGNNPTVEDILRSKGEKVRRGSLGTGGVVEYYD